MFLLKKLIDLTSYFLGIVYFQSGRLNPILIFENNYYIMERRKAEKTLWRCSKSTSKCKSRIASLGDSIVVNGLHNHYPEKEINQELPSRIINVKRTNNTRAQNSMVKLP